MITKHSFLLALAGLAYSFGISSQTFVADGIKYEVLSQSEQTCKVAQLNRGLSGDIVLPGTVTNPSTNIQYTLKEIGSFAFTESYSITSISIPSTVTDLHLSAFSSCLILPSLHIPASVTSIRRADYIGEELYALKKITVAQGNPCYDSREDCNAIIDSRTNELILGCGTTKIPNSVTKIGNFSFYMRKNLEVLNIPSSVLTIGQKAFYGCDGLESVTIPSGVTTLGNNSFTECQGLQEIYISETVSQIGNAFASCPLLRRIQINENNPYYDSRGGCNAIIETSSNKMILASNSTTFIPNTVAAIGDAAFNFYDRIVSLVIPESVRSIGIQAFFHCTNLVSVTLPEGITRLNLGTFSGCSSLKAVSIPSTVDTLMTDVFNNCESLESIIIPKRVSLIYGDLFQGCSSLKSIKVEEGNTYFDSRENCNAIIRTSSDEVVSGCINTSFPKSVKSLGVASFRGRNNIVDMVLPDQIEVIDAQTFAFCSNLRSITLPRNLKSMGNAAFMECSSLERVCSRIEEPFNFGTYVWDASMIASATLVVPLGCREKYLQLDDWKGFGNIVEEDFFNNTDTDLSTIDNTLYVEHAEVHTGTQAMLNIAMKNMADIRGFECKLYLPEGVTAAKSPKGKVQGSLCDGRLPDEDEHTLTFSEHNEDGYYVHILCGSEYEETFTGNDGTIIMLLVNIAEDMEDGDYPVILKNIKLSENDIRIYYETERVISTLTVTSYILGDINGDGKVDVSDYIGVANHIHGKTPEGFNAAAADVDESGSIDVSDYIGIANIIHTGSPFGKGK